MLLLHEFPGTLNQQVNVLSSEAVTLKIIRVTRPGTQVTLTLEVKAGLTVALPLGCSTLATTLASSNSIDTTASCWVRLNLQFSCLFVDPS